MDRPGWKIRPVTNRSWLQRLAIRRPLLLPVLFLAYLAGFILMVAAMALFSRWVLVPIGMEGAPWVRKVLGAAAMGWLAFLLLHYFKLVLVSASENLALKLTLSRVARTLQVLVSVILVSAVAYYYLQLLSRDTAFAGVHPIFASGGPGRTIGGLDLLFVVPPVETIVDCLYFSVVTASTVGFGDIRPVAWWAKLAVLAELAASFVVIVLALGAARDS